MEVRIDRKTMRALLECEILEIRNAEDKVVSLEEAERDPEEVMVFSSSKKAFSLHIDDEGTYTLTEEGWSL